MALYEESVQDRASAERFLDWCIEEIGGGFHPDTSFAEYIDLSNNEPVFDEQTAKQLQTLLDDTFAYCDPYEYGLPALQLQLRLDL